jgi:hypothetical protein
VNLGLAGLSLSHCCPTRLSFTLASRTCFSFTCLDGIGLSLSDGSVRNEFAQHGIELGITILCLI